MKIPEQQAAITWLDSYKIIAFFCMTWLLTFLLGQPLRAAAGPLETLLQVVVMTPVWIVLAVKTKDVRLVLAISAITLFWQGGVATLNRLPSPSVIAGHFPFSGKVLAVVLALVSIAWIGRGRWKEYGCTLRLKPGTTGRTVVILLGTAGLLFALAMAFLATEAISSKEFLAMSSITKMPLWEAAVFQFLLVAVAEELVHRGFLQTYLDRLLKAKIGLWGADLGWGFFIVALVFTLCHVIEIRTTPFRLITNPTWMLAGIPMAFLLGYLRAYTGSLLPPIILHGLWNGLGDVVIPYLIRGR